MTEKKATLTGKGNIALPIGIREQLKMKKASHPFIDIDKSSIAFNLINLFLFHPMQCTFFIHGGIRSGKTSLAQYITQNLINDHSFKFMSRLNVEGAEIYSDACQIEPSEVVDDSFDVLVIDEIQSFTKVMEMYADTAVRSRLKGLIFVGNPIDFNALTMAFPSIMSIEMDELDTCNIRSMELYQTEEKGGTFFTTNQTIYKS